MSAERFYAVRFFGSVIQSASQSIRNGPSRFWPSTECISSDGS